MRNRNVCITGVLALLATSCGTMAPAKINHIVIATDKSVNCSTLQTIASDVCRGCKTDEDKAVAVFDFVVRTIWIHYAYDLPKEMVNGQLRSADDPLKMINVYGAGGCGMQSTLFSTLLDAAGLKERLLAPGFAHVSNEVFWGGRWHWLDTWLPAYFTGEKGEIYSYDELMADRALAPNALKAGRTSANFMFNPSDMNALKTAKDFRSLGSGVKKPVYSENLTLRPGESCTWLWDNVGKWYWPGETFACPAFKFPADKNCKRAFPFWEPYAKAIKGGPHSWNDTYYRYFGNAIFVHEPALTEQGMADVEAELKNIRFAAAGGLRSAPSKSGTAEVKNTRFAAAGGLRSAASKTGTVELRFDLPYSIADTEIEGFTELPKGGTVAFAYSLDGGRTWKKSRAIDTAGKFEKFSIGTPNSRDYPAGTTSGRYGFLLRITLSGSKHGPATLRALKVTNMTMLNFYSRPWLEPGKNAVTVTAAEGSDLADAPLEVTWRWLEDWTQEKTFTHKVTKNNAACVIEVGGTKRPKMKSITIACPAR